MISLYICESIKNAIPFNINTETLINIKINIVRIFLLKINSDGAIKNIKAYQTGVSINKVVCSTLASTDADSIALINKANTNINRKNNPKV